MASIARHSAYTSGSTGLLIEHYAGNFLLWLAPEQVRVITLNDDAAPSTTLSPS